MSTGTLAAAILTGGRARRLGGACKAALLLDGRRIIDRQLERLRTVAAAIFLVGREPDGGVPAGVELVADRVPDGGALGGIYTALLASPCERTLVVACDMPFLSVALLNRLASVEDADLVIPRSARGYEPLCAIYRRACAGDIGERLARGERQASVLPASRRVTEIGPDELAAMDPDGLMFVNVNTPHDYARARGLLEMQTEPGQDRITDGS
jgi:molybdopterin-guanine dinucleotide biosynthesis protein A